MILTAKEILEIDNRICYDDNVWTNYAVKYFCIKISKKDTKEDVVKFIKRTNSYLAEDYVDDDELLNEFVDAIFKANHEKQFTQDFLGYLKK